MFLLRNVWCGNGAETKEKVVVLREIQRATVYTRELDVHCYNTSTYTGTCFDPWKVPASPTSPRSPLSSNQPILRNTLTPPLQKRQNRPQRHRIHMQRHIQLLRPRPPIPDLNLIQPSPTRINQQIPLPARRAPIRSFLIAQQRSQTCIPRRLVALHAVVVPQHHIVTKLPSELAVAIELVSAAEMLPPMRVRTWERSMTRSSGRSPA
ncbi:hypothetical protein CC86DRAFT_428111 [Ophiobolus disseminans]|uniref:Uncharacterized protein n=1 Tax=Ophiobolus disseminans TaxID=1469910 RepID=A0A6A6ZHP1_9PLEO|nr:hypothetical protein CC86DRAFT_428111 [Ophiobolus disseminans]